MGCVMPPQLPTAQSPAPFYTGTVFAPHFPSFSLSPCWGPATGVRGLPSRDCHHDPRWPCSACFSQVEASRQPLGKVQLARRQMKL